MRRDASIETTWRRRCRHGSSMRRTGIPGCVRQRQAGCISDPGHNSRFAEGERAGWPLVSGLGHGTQPVPRPRFEWVEGIFNGWGSSYPPGLASMGATPATWIIKRRRGACGSGAILLAPREQFVVGGTNVMSVHFLPVGHRDAALGEDFFVRDGGVVLAPFVGLGDGFGLRSTECVPFHRRDAGS